MIVSSDVVNKDMLLGMRLVMIQYSLCFFHQPTHPREELFLAPCNPAHLSAAVRGGSVAVYGGLLNYLYK